MNEDEVMAVASAICEAQGLDPDHSPDGDPGETHHKGNLAGTGFPDPICANWALFTDDARAAIKALDEKRKTGKIRSAAEFALNQLCRMTSDDFAKGKDRAARERLANALGLSDPDAPF